MKERLLSFMSHEGLSAARFADIIGVQRSSVSHILSGRNLPGFDFILKTLSHFKHLNAHWLILGEGEMLITKSNVSNTSNVKDEELPLYHSSQRSIPIKDTIVNNKGITNVNNDLSLVTDAGVNKIVIFYKNGRFEEFSASK